MGSKNDLAYSARTYPDDYASHIALERVIDHTMYLKTVKKKSVPVSLSEAAGVPVDESLVSHHVRRWKSLQSKLHKAPTTQNSTVSKTTRNLSKSATHHTVDIEEYMAAS